MLNYVIRERRDYKRLEAYLPLEFDRGEDAQMDWGEALAEIGDQPIIDLVNESFLGGSIPA